MHVLSNNYGPSVVHYQCSVDGDAAVCRPVVAHCAYGLRGRRHRSQLPQTRPFKHPEVTVETDEAQMKQREKIYFMAAAVIPEGCY
jgi:hypothetical protein